jgi:D-serine deaminase-like pyridoxal phosphate-dependent protein
MELPTPSVVLSKPILQRNADKMLRDVKALDISFRPHVKTLKVGDPRHRIG